MRNRTLGSLVDAALAAGYPIGGAAPGTPGARQTSGAASLARWIRGEAPFETFEGEHGVAWCRGFRRGDKSRRRR